MSAIHEVPHLVRSYAALEQAAPLTPYAIERRAVGPQDIQIQILFTGICHSDLHAIDNSLGDSNYPLVPGHEIVGRITQLGREALSHFKIGDRVAVGCMVDSCGTCDNCRDSVEQYCPEATWTYNSPDKQTGAMTYGGFSESIVVNQKFVFKVPDSLDGAAAAPLLCAGVTPYSALRHWKVETGKRVGVIGLGGLGHMAIKLACAFGAQVSLLTTSPHKVEEGKRLGASEVILSTDPEQMAQHANSFDFILSTSGSASLDLDGYISLLRRDGTLCLLGTPAIKQMPVTTAFLTFTRKNIAGSMIAGTAETQELLDYCATHSITPDVEVVSPSEINAAIDRLRRGDVKYRFVIDMLKGSS